MSDMESARHIGRRNTQSEVTLRILCPEEGIIIIWKKCCVVRPDSLSILILCSLRNNWKRNSESDLVK